MNPLWEQFIAESILSDEQGEAAKVGEAQPPGSWHPESAEFTVLFPAMAQLFSKASVSAVEMDGRKHQLISWQQSDAEMAGWLCPTPVSAPSTLFQEHNILLKSFGGIIEYVGAPPNTWIMSHDQVLTLKAAEQDARLIKDYEWAFEGSPVPIDLDQFYAIAIEANGNTTLCHRITGEVVLFAPDHAFNHVLPYPGCPEYTLYNIEGGRDFRSWVNAVASQWLM
jgi:hypothetical protein